MSKVRTIFTSFAVAILSFCFGAFLTYVTLWRFYGLNKLSPDEAGAAAMGAFAVFVKSAFAGTLAAVIGVAWFVFRRRQRLRGRLSVRMD